MSSHLTSVAGRAVPLEYDGLPEGSRLRRTWAAGGVTITAPAGEPSPAVRRAASRSAVVCAGAVCGAVLLVGGLIARSSRIDPSLRVAALLSLGALGASVFLLVWWVLYSARVYALADVRRQAVVLHADPVRLLVETSGPLGDHSLDLAVGDILSVQVVAHRLGGLRPAASIAHLCLRMRDGANLPLLPGHHVDELRWVADTLAECTRIQLVTVVPKRGWMPLLTEAADPEAATTGFKPQSRGHRKVVN